jgi:hypothetical protein
MSAVGALGTLLGASLAGEGEDEVSMLLGIGDGIVPAPVFLRFFRARLRFDGGRVLAGRVNVALDHGAGVGRCGGSVAGSTSGAVWVRNSGGGSGGLGEKVAEGGATRGRAYACGRAGEFVGVKEVLGQ